MSVQTAKSSERRRPRRIAADEAHAWARNLRLGNPYAKLVLSMLTIYVNGEGSCFVSIAQLAEDCELAENTIRRRLTFLEQVGAITKFAQWRDEHGRLNGEGRGRRTTDDIRLLINADPDDIEARAAGNGDHDDGQESEENNAVRGARGEPLDCTPNPVSPSLGVQQPSHCGQGLISEPEPEPKDSPLPPKGGHAQHSQDSDGKEDSPKLASWQRFEQAWQEPILRQSIARQVWSALTEGEEEIAIKAAKGYVAHRRSQKKPPNVINAHTFLRERDAWAGFAAIAPSEQKAVIPQRFVSAESAEFRARQVIDVLLGHPPRQARVIADKGSGYMIQGDEPGLELLALSQFDPFDQSGWVELWHEKREHKHQLGAWRERVGELNWKSVETGEVIEVLGNRYPRRERFSLVPCEWPPRRDGTLSTTGPPAAA